MVELTCPSCGRPAPSGATHCPHDGTDLGFGETFVGRQKDVLSPPTQPVELSDSLRMELRAAQRLDPIIGQALNGYVVEERIGEGGMGVVYRAVQQIIDKHVAIKVLRHEIASDPEQVKRLVEEARAVNAVGHRGIVDIFGFGKLPTGQDFVVMEFLRGQPLDAVITERGRLPPQEVVFIIGECLDALAAAHGAGVVHRDLKPNNIFLVSGLQGQRYLKILDFGLAKRGQANGSIKQTRTDVVVGTPEYMAPEQARGEPVSPRTDLYSLGVVAFELLTGTVPFLRNSPLETMIAQLESQPPSPSSLVEGLPPELDELVLQLLEKDPLRRPVSADVVRARLRKIQKSLAQATTQIGPVPLAPPSSSRTAQPSPSAAQTATASAPPVHRGPLPPRTIFAAVAIVGVAAAGAFFLLRQSPTTGVSPPAAQSAEAVSPPARQERPAALPAPSVEAPQPPPAPAQVAAPTVATETTRTERDAAAEPAAARAPRGPTAIERRPKVQNEGSTGTAATQRRLVRRLGQLERRVEALRAQGQLPDRTLPVFLARLREDLGRPASRAELEELEKRLAILEKRGR